MPVSAIIISVEVGRTGSDAGAASGSGPSLIGLITGNQNSCQVAGLLRWRWLTRLQRGLRPARLAGQEDVPTGGPGGRKRRRPNRASYVPRSASRSRRLSRAGRRSGPGARRRPGRRCRPRRGSPGPGFGEHLRDLARREVDDRGDLAAEEVLGAVVLDELGRAGLQPQLGPEVDDEAVGGLARRLVRKHLDDGADADVDLEEVVEGDGHAAASGAGSGPSAAPDRRGPSVHAVQRATVSAWGSRRSSSAIVLAWSGVSSRARH